MSWVLGPESCVLGASGLLTGFGPSQGLAASAAQAGVGTLDSGLWTRDNSSEKVGIRMLVPKRANNH